MSSPITASPVEQIDLHSRQYAAAREVLAERVSKFEAEVQAIRNRLLPGIKSAAAAAATQQGELAADVVHYPELFVKPRTMTLHGIRLGYIKGKGKITWEDDAKVIAAIRRTFAQDTADKLIAIVERPVKDALANLPAHELRRLGVQVEEAGDQVYIKAIDTEVDKLVARILQEGAVGEAEAS